MACLFALTFTMALATPKRQSVWTATVTGRYSYTYLLYLPAGYAADPARRFPLMIFLHGSGQSGSNPDAVTQAGPPLEIELGRDFPCLVISPQAPTTNWDVTALDAFIQDCVQKYLVDPDRVYVTGLSMGGYGTWAVATRSPDRYAAAMPLCGGGDPTQAAVLRDLPIWAFHGELDTTVLPVNSVLMIDAIRSEGGNPKLTLYPTLAHDVWSVTYANDEVYAWLFAQSRVRAPSMPLVGTQPQPQSAVNGANVTFSVKVGGIPAPALQWQRRPAGSGAWEPLSEGGSYRGVTTATLTVGPATAAMAGDQFRCAISNASGAALSAPATLSVAGTGSVTLQSPSGLALDAAGNLYVADASSNTVRKISPGGSVGTLAGSDTIAGAADGFGTAAHFNLPGGIAVDAAGDVFVADTGNSTIRKINPAGGVTTLAGLSTARGHDDGAGLATSFNQPAAVALDAGGNLFVADTMNATIRKVTPDGVVTTVAGQAGVRGEVDGVGAAARFNSPRALVVDRMGNVYVADTFNDTIRRIAPDGTVTTIAGSAGLAGATDLTGNDALFNQPAGLALDPAGNLYVADTANAAIRMIAPGRTVKTLAGNAGVAGFVNGAGTAALFNQPQALALDSAGNLYVADTGNSALRKVASDRSVTTLSLIDGSPAPVTPAPTPAPATPTTPSSSNTSGGGGSVGAPFAIVLLLLLGRGRGRFKRG